MASPRNQNQQKGGAGGGGGGGGAFDVQRLFNPSVSSSPSSQITTLQNPNNPYLPPSSAAASYPPPTVTGGPYSYNPPQANNPMFHHQFHIPPPPFPPQSDNHLHSNLPHQRSLPYPASPLQPPSPNNTNPNPNHGARLMALLSSPLPSTPDMPPQLPPAPTQNLNFNAVLPSSAPLLPSGAGPLRMPSSKLPKGRHLVGDHVVYDIDVRLAGEIQPQLEVTPITKYGSDPGLVVGRQIAVNKTYICYGLKPGTIRRVTDMAFFAEDVHLLASASMDGRVYVWKITEGPDEDDKPLITGKIVIAVQIVGEGEPFHPRVCWHCHKQEVLVVGIGKRILRLDTTKVGRGEAYTAEEPLKCSVDKLIDGVQFVGKHDGEVTDLSMCQWMTTRLVSASVDGTIKIWEDHKSSPIAVLRPYDGLPVNSVTFLTAPHRPDHIILITGGPLNREVKIWASESEEGWLLPSDADSWHCTQTLELKSFAEPRVEDAFFNQVVALSQAGLLLLANAKKNAIYAVHLEYGPNPESTRMDYIAEFTVTMPILSFTGTSHLLLHGEHIVQVYCVQTQAIQQYALDLSQCLPPPIYDVVHEKSGSTEGCSGSETSGGKLDEIGSEGAPTLSQPVSSPLTDVAISKGLFTSGAEAKSIPSPIANDTDISCVVSPTVPTSPKLSGKLSDFRSPSSGFEPRNQLNGYGDQKIMELEAAHSNLSSVVSLDDDIRTENKVAKDDGSTIPDRTVKFKHPTHLVTPAELMATSSSEVNHVTDDVAVNSATKNVEAEIKVMGKMGISQNADSALQGELHGSAFEVKEKSFSSQASGLGLDMARDNHVEPRETYMVKESKQLNEIVESKVVDQTSDARDDGQDTATDLSGPVQPTVPGMVQSAAPTSRAKKQKGKNVQTLRALKSIDSSDELGASSRKRIEAVVGKSMEKIYKANSDAWWARTQEEFAKQEKTNRDRHQQISTSASNGHKDLLAASEKSMKKEMAAAVSVIGRSVTPVIEKAVSTAVSESFQRGIGDKAVNQLEKTVNSKLEANEALKSSMEASVIPAFEMSCKTMFDQVDATFQNGIVEHTSAAQRQAESVHSPLVFALRDTINSASSVTQILSNELSDGQRKLMALAVAGATSKLVNPLISNGPSGGFHEKIEAPVDPAKELSRLIYEHKYEEAFTTALQRSDVQIVSWLCSQGILTRNPIPLSQGVLLSLLQQLACDIVNDTSKKLGWMMDLVVAIKPSDGIIAMHVRPIFEQVQSMLNHQASLLPTTSVAELSSIRVVMKLVNSTLRSL
ncbi:WD40 repeat-containing protein [Cynara cardunculus var. scolymus]|uniref:WD40 repeat-containing protein n=1 Tax=Cynara cardunculus var. scolymus TaxID=59895 RepID=A0A103YJK9_CYNCS|nr:WD40 repeat-containing protein [Cynara cardunculus var. scolymus]